MKEKHKEYLKLFGNEARREFVIKEFRNGVFSDQSHMDFYLEQYAKGEISVDKEEDGKRLSNLLKGEFIDEHVSNLSKSILANEASPKTYVGAGDTYGMKSDLGIEGAVEGYKNNKIKHELDNIIEEAKYAAAQRKLGGSVGKYNDVIAKASEALSDSKWWQLRRKHQLKRAIKDIDPSAYYGTKVVYAGNAVTASY